MILSYCPHDGSADIELIEYHKYAGSTKVVYQVRCVACGACGGVRDRRDEAAAAWNARWYADIPPATNINKQDESPETLRAKIADLLSVLDTLRTVDNLD